MFENLPLTLTLAQEDPRPGSAPNNDGAAPPANGGGGGTPGTNTSEPANGTPGTNVSEGANGKPKGDGDPAPGSGQTQPPMDWTLPGILLLFLVVMFGMTFFSQRKEKKRRREMLAALSKNDRVVTIGGVIGTVVEVRDSEVVVKVDESSNTRMRFSRAAIQSVLTDTEDLPAQ
jgi:preprotein translocase subunit YajC